MEKKSTKKKHSIKKSAKSKSKHSHDEHTSKEGEEDHKHTNEVEEGGGGGLEEEENKKERSLRRNQSAMSLTGSRKVTDEERQEIWEAFKTLDEDGDGKLGFEEMKKLLQSQFMTFTDTAAAEVIQQLDEDGSGGIEFKEFEKYVIDNNLCKPTQEEFSSEMRAAFEMFDSDNNGFIDINEFRALMGNVGDKMTEADIAEMMKEADTNGDGFIDYRVSVFSGDFDEKGVSLKGNNQEYLYKFDLFYFMTYLPSRS